MGKRELVIVLGFLAAGVLAYQLTAAPSEADRGFSIGRLFEAWRREARANLERSTFVHEGVIAAGDRSELRLWNIREVDVIGEARADIGYRLTVEAAGPDAPSAEASARATRLVEDALGDALVLRVEGPQGVRQTSALILRVPRTLALRIESSRRATVRGAAAVHLEGTTGEMTIREASGIVSGTHRNGPLSLEDARDLDLTLVNAEASFAQITGKASIKARGGSTRISSSPGSVTVEITGASLQLDEVAQTRVSGTNGEVTIARPVGEVAVDVRGARVAIALERPIDMTILTTEDPIAITMPPGLPVAIDAATREGGTIDARAFGLTVDTRDGETRLQHTFGDAARISIRNRRGDIVITEGK